MEGVNKIINIVDSLTTYINKSIDTLPDANVEILLECINVHLRHIKIEAVSLKMDLIADDTSEESNVETNVEHNFEDIKTLLSSFFQTQQKDDKKNHSDDMKFSEDNMLKLILNGLNNCQDHQKDSVDQFKNMFGKMFAGKL